MAAFTLRSSGAMASEGDGGLWIGLGGLTLSIVFAAIGYISRGFKSAAAEGQSVGELRQWKQVQESTMRALEMKIDAAETRSSGRISALEIRREAIDIKLASLPTRDEMTSLFGRLDDKFDRLDAYMHGKH